MMTIINSTSPIHKSNTFVEETDWNAFTSNVKVNKKYSIISDAIFTVESMISLLTMLANVKFDEIKNKTEISRDSQDMANRVDRVIAELSKPDSTGVLPKEVIEYMKNNKIMVDGKTIDEFLSESKIDDVDKIKKIESLRSHIDASGKEGKETKYYQDVIKYMKDNNILVDGKDADWFRRVLFRSKIYEGQ